MKKITENSTKKIGEYLTLKEARTALKEQDCQHGYNYKPGEFFNPVPIYQESDGTYSLKVPKVKTSKVVEAVDAQSGRRFEVVEHFGKQMYRPKKQMQFHQWYRGPLIIE